MTIWLSILVPVYNSGIHLRTCLNSILAQKVTGIEIILFDDGSTDDTTSICLEFEKKFPEIVQFNSASINEGIGPARNALLDSARGQHVWFVDSDDYLLPCSLEKVRSVLEAHNPDLMICDYLRNEKQHKKSFSGPSGKLSFEKDQLISGIFKYRKLYCWQKVFRRDILDKAPKFPKQRVFEDIAVIGPALQYVETYFYLAEPLIVYRVHDKSLMGRFSRTKAIFDVQKHEDLLAALARLTPLSEPPFHESEAIKFWVSSYVAREYLKAMKRYDLPSTEQKPSRKSYKERFESHSPLNFKTLGQEYRKRNMFLHALKLFRMLGRA